jgi:hypothetical protein
MSSTHKKVVVRKLNRDSVNGYVAPTYIVDGQLELLNTEGKLVRLELADVKEVYFVRDFAEPDTLVRKTFTTRPRVEGLWVRLKFRDNDVLEGMMANNLAESAEGFLLNPPDARSNTQRIFVPHSALSELRVLAVIGGSKPRKRSIPPDARQVSMFEQ